MNALGARFPPSVADRLQEPEGEAVVHVTPSARARRESPLRWALMGCHDRAVHASLVLDGEKRLRFSRAGATVKADAAHLLEDRTWCVELRWSAERLEVSVRPA